MSDAIFVTPGDENRIFTINIILPLIDLHRFYALPFPKLIQHTRTRYTANSVPITRNSTTGQTIHDTRLHFQQLLSSTCRF